MGRPNGFAEPSTHPRNDYERTVRELSDRLVAAQKPIRVLDAVKWDDSVERSFFASRARELPRVNPDYYAARPLPFDAPAKQSEISAIERDARRQLGKNDPAGNLLLGKCQQYRNVVRLLSARGTRSFGHLSRDLYGTSLRKRGEPDAVGGLGGALERLLDGCECKGDPSFDSGEAVRELSDRLAAYFGEPVVQVKLSDGIVADAAAGSDYLKLRRNARFTACDVRLLEVHEGWVHLGTTINGQRQPVLSCLSKGPPSATRTQEGLAVLTEFLAGASHPGRWRRLLLRFRGLALAEQGADFLQVYRFFLDGGAAPPEAYHQAVRIFRGSVPTGGGPFTKDVCYGRGLLQVLAFVRQALEQGQWDSVQLLFCGKTALEDLPALAELLEAGLLVPPQHLPPPFRDPYTLAEGLKNLTALCPGERPA